MAAIVENTSDVVYIKDNEGRYLFFNSAAERAIGKKREAVLGRDDTFLFPRDEALEIMEADRRIMDTGQTSSREELITMADGTTRTFWSTKGVVRSANDSVIGVFGISRDITERTTTEQALIASEMRFKSLIENVSDATAVVGEDGIIRYISPSAKRLSGYEPDELVGKNFFDLLHPDDVQRRIADLATVIRNPDEIVTSELRYRTKDGSWRVAETRSKNLLADAGVRGIVVNVRDVTERKLAEDNLRDIDQKLRTNNSTLLAIRHINAHLLVTKSEQELYQYVCDSLMGMEEILTVWIGLKMPDFAIKPVACAGTDLARLSALDFRWDDSESSRRPVAEAIRTGKPVVLDNLDSDVRFDPWRKTLRERGVRSMVAVPIHVESEVKGALVIWARQPCAFDAESVEFIVEVGGDIALGVRTLQLTTKLAATLKSLQGALNSTVEAIANIVEYRDPYTAGHERRVAQLACAIGTEMLLPEKMVEGLRVMGYLHDIGKVVVPAEILSKPTKLTDIEYALIKQHSEVGNQILKGLDFPWAVAQAVLQHHERLDGSGYPHGLKGDEIILEARILAVADTVEAMSSHRPYRPGLGIDAALGEVLKNRGRIYDPGAVDACVRLIRDKGFRLEA